MESSTVSSPPALPERRRHKSQTPRLSTPPAAERRSSTLSYASFDDTRQSVQSSASDFLLPGLGLGLDDHDDGPSHWHSTPLIFAILPALGGLFFTNGNHFITDILLLGLAAIFLNWSVRLPWEWYHSAQAVIPGVSSRRLDEAVLDPLDDEHEQDKSTSSLKDSTQSREALHDGEDTEANEDEGDDEVTKEDAALRLRSHEKLALVALFVCPAMAAYLLHVIRGQLSKPSTGLVSDYNLSIFVLAAEIRPVRQLIRLVTLRTLHLQRIVSGPEIVSATSIDSNSSLESRIQELEARLARSDSTADTKSFQKEETARLSNELRKRYEPRLEALERAVRRYEKRATTLTLLTEQRLQSLETRIQDALSLAAVAANQSQKPGKIATLLSTISKVMMLPLEAAWFAVVWPLNFAEDVLRMVTEALLGRSATRRRNGEPDPKGARNKGKKRADSAQLEDRSTKLR